jgi:hypothetical protein
VSTIVAKSDRSVKPARTVKAMEQQQCRKYGFILIVFPLTLKNINTVYTQYKMMMKSQNQAKS